MFILGVYLFNFNLWALLLEENNSDYSSFYKPNLIFNMYVFYHYVFLECVTTFDIPYLPLS